MWSLRKSRVSPTRDRAAEVVMIQRQALEITKGIRAELDRLEETLRTQPVTQKDVKND